MAGSWLGDVGGGAKTGAGIGAAIGSVVPGVGTAIGTAAGGAIGGVVGLAANLFPETVGGLLSGPNAEAIAPAIEKTVRDTVGTADPGVAAARLADDPALNETLAARFRAIADVEASLTERFRAEVLDRGDARKTYAASQATGNRTADRLAWLILGSFLAVALAILAGCGLLLSGRVSLSGTGVSPEVAVAVSGLVGAILGYFSANAQQVSSFYYGSNAASQHKTELLAAQRDRR